MTEKERYVMGRADYLHDKEGLSLTEGSEIAEREFEGDTDEEFQKLRAEALNSAKKTEEIVMTKWLTEIGYKRNDPVGYFRNYYTMEMEIYTTCPGQLIGKAGINIDKLKKLMLEYFYAEWKVKFIEVRGGFVNVNVPKVEYTKPVEHNESTGVKLNDVLSVISGGTRLIIYVDSKEMFFGTMANVNKYEWERVMGQYMDREVIRLNTHNDSITIAV